MKKLFLTIACLVSALAAFAETGSDSDTREIKVIEETKDSTLLFVNKFSKNWEVSLYLGVQNFLAEYTRFNTLNDMWCPAIDFNINVFNVIFLLKCFYFILPILFNISSKSRSIFLLDKCLTSSSLYLGIKCT